jgi:hypothetical protein
MEGNLTPSGGTSADFSTTTRYFLETASQCFDTCIKDFKEKDLSEVEQKCVNGCFTKQMIVYGSLVQNLSQQNQS